MKMQSHCDVYKWMTSFVLSFFPLDVLDEIWDLIESVSKGFLTYSIEVDVTSIKIEYLHLTSRGKMCKPCVKVINHKFSH